MSEHSQAISVQESGRRGGNSLLRKKGRQFFVQIGKTGQRAMRVKYPGMAPEWGKRGGRPKKMALDEIVGQEDKYHAERR